MFLSLCLFFATVGERVAIDDNVLVVIRGRRGQMMGIGEQMTETI